VGKDNHRLKMRYNEKKSTKHKEEKISKEHNWREEKEGKKKKTEKGLHFQIVIPLDLVRD